MIMKVEGKIILTQSAFLTVSFPCTFDAQREYFRVCRFRRLYTMAVRHLGIVIDARLSMLYIVSQ